MLCWVNSARPWTERGNDLGWTRHGMALYPVAWPFFFSSKVCCGMGRKVCGFRAGERCFCSALRCGRSRPICSCLLKQLFLIWYVVAS